MPISLRHQIKEKMLYTKWIPAMTSSAKCVMAGMEGIMAISEYVV